MEQVDLDPILIGLRTAIEDAYGDRVERLVLFGSRARRSEPGLGLRRGRVSAAL